MRYVVEGWNYKDIEPERYICEGKAELISWYENYGYKFSETRTITVSTLKQIELKSRSLNE